MTKFSYPSDLAREVKKRLQSMKCRAPSLLQLTRLLEEVFFASMKTEEAEPISCSLTYISANKPDPSPPRRILANRWTYSRFDEPIPLTAEKLVKISKSFDSDAASLAVHVNEKAELVIWGAIDQRGRRMAYVRREISEGAENPGVFEVSITGVGSLEVYKDYEMIAALRQGRLDIGFNDVLEKPGPIQNAFMSTVEELVDSVRTKVGCDIFKKRDHWPDSIASHWRVGLARILLRIQKYAHGGSILLTPDLNQNELKVKYRIEYPRLSRALYRLSVNAIQHCDAEDAIFEDFLDADAEMMPIGLYLDETVFSAEEEDSEEEITGCVSFIASLSRVDGLILMNHDLSVRGYGAIVTVENEDFSTWIARDEKATSSKLKRIDRKTFGTRHQSMMKICFSHQGSVGFVVSQDGEIRAMMRVGKKLVVWEDIKLRLA